MTAKNLSALLLSIGSLAAGVASASAQTDTESGVTGTVSGHIRLKSPLGAASLVRLPQFPVELLTPSSKARDTVWTDARGRFFIESLASPVWSIVRTWGRLHPGEGASLKVMDGSFRAASDTLRVEPGTMVELLFSRDESTVRRLTAYYWVTRLDAIYRARASPPRPERPIDLYVDVGTHCNGSNILLSGGKKEKITLAREGPKGDVDCQSTAYADFVLHEYGHSVQRRGKKYSPKGDGGFKEGFADALAMVVADTSCFGRDIRGPGSCRRTAGDLPGPYKGRAEDDYIEGLRYATFVWHFMSALRERPGMDAREKALALLFHTIDRLEASDSIREAIGLAFEIGDPDRDPANGVPFCGEKTRAAKAAQIGWSGLLSDGRRVRCA